MGLPPPHAEPGLGFVTCWGGWGLLLAACLAIRQFFFPGMQDGEGSPMKMVIAVLFVFLDFFFFFQYVSDPTEGSPPFWPESLSKTLMFLPKEILPLVSFCVNSAFLSLCLSLKSTSYLRGKERCGESCPQKVTLLDLGVKMKLSFVAWSLVPNLGT